MANMLNTSQGKGLCACPLKPNRYLYLPLGLSLPCQHVEDYRQTNARLTATVLVMLLRNQKGRWGDL